MRSLSPAPRRTAAAGPAPRPRAARICERTVVAALVAVITGACGAADRDGTTAPTGAPSDPTTKPSAGSPQTNAPPPLAEEADSPRDAYAAFAALEARLLAAPAIDLRFHVESTGAVASALEGKLALRPAQHADLVANGSFGGQTASATLSATAEQMSYASGRQDQVSLERPADLDGSLLIGMTRMGLLHNLAMLVGGRAPDHTDGTVDQWARVGSVAWGEPAPIDGRPSRALNFALTVDGEPSGHATLWIDKASGLPGRREQTVDFDGETMHVIEVYDWIEPTN
ncbi:MAG: hypothetical protein B7733_16060 [Myxococcales bacterium FL481]|nr:MAG: hypothetical protein B7733_16060 [Myxococcales bacterium FL481]